MLLDTVFSRTLWNSDMVSYEHVDALQKDLRQDRLKTEETNTSASKPRDTQMC